jgi:hypothetical protein
MILLKEIYYTLVNIIMRKQSEVYFQIIIEFYSSKLQYQLVGELSLIIYQD